MSTMPEQPNLEYQVRDENGVEVNELTPESEAAWTKYLRQLWLAEQALKQVETERNIDE